MIKGIHNGRGEWVDKGEDIIQVVSDHFEDIFNTSNPPSEIMLEATDAVDMLVTREMNDELIKEPTECEIYDALSQMHPKKAQVLMVCMLCFIKSSGT